MRKRILRPKLNNCTINELKNWMADYFCLMNCDVKSLTDYVLVAIRWLDHNDQKFTNDSYKYPDNDTVNQKPFSIGDVFQKIIRRKDEIDELRDFGKGQVSKDWQLSFRETKQKPVLITRDRIKYMVYWMVHCGILDVATKHHDTTGQWKNYKTNMRRPSYVFWLREVPNRFTLHPLRVYRTLWEVNNPDKYNFNKPKILKSVRLVPPSWIVNPSADNEKKEEIDFLSKVPAMPRPVQPSLFNGENKTLNKIKDHLTIKKENEEKVNREIKRFSNSYRSAFYENGKLFVGIRLTPGQAKLLINELNQISDQVRLVSDDLWPDKSFKKGEWV